MDKLQNNINKKCGEVFLTFKGMTIFHCTLCESKYNVIQNFGVHVLEKHMAKYSDVFSILELEIDSLLPNILNVTLDEPNSNFKDLDKHILNENADSSSHIDEIEMTKDDNYDKHCGEVHLTKNGILIFSCSLCNINYKGVQDYNQHVIEDHYVSEDIEEPNFKNPCHENDTNNQKSENCNTPKENKVTTVKAKIKGDNGFTTDDADPKTHSSCMQEDKKLKKGVPKWKQTFEPFKCSVSKKELYKCKLCGAVISDKSNIHHHIKRVHEQSKRFECTVCQKLFHYKTNLKIHSRQHTGEKPYLCVECGRAFVTASSLNSHKLINHTQLVRDKACPICEKTFTTRRTLLRHRTVHSEERPFKCKICGAGFKIKSSLKIHNRIHEDKKVFKCALCSASYNYKSILESHMKSQHAVAIE